MPNKTSSARAAVKVSYKLQTVAVAVLLMSVVLQVIYILPALTHSTGYDLSADSLIFIANTLMPVLVFVLLYLFSGRYVSTMNRLFMATVKTGIILGLYGLIQGVRTLFVNFMYRYQPGAVHGFEPRWMTSAFIDIAIAGICVVIVIAYILKSSRKV